MYKDKDTIINAYYVQVQEERLTVLARNLVMRQVYAVICPQNYSGKSQTAGSRLSLKPGSHCRSFTILSELKITLSHAASYCAPSHMTSSSMIACGSMEAVVTVEPVAKGQGDFLCTEE